ncbi:MAG: tRNA adenosine(34) deaminase TadA [Firmicutes bacterium]|nr:tRNA adenosine(34) deaminase TadA [Bacillota bacterium]
MEQETYMREALKEAEKALALEEVPIGAVVVKDGEIVGRGYNRRETDKDPTAHAEMIAIRQASETLGGWRLHQCELYVTVEPCPMCAGAIMLSRIRKLYIGTADPKAGACGSLINIPQDERFNHTVPMETGVLEEECREILQRFFAKLRETRKKK